MFVYLHTEKKGFYFVLIMAALDARTSDALFHLAAYHVSAASWYLSYNKTFNLNFCILSNCDKKKLVWQYLGSLYV